MNATREHVRKATSGVDSALQATEIDLNASFDAIEALLSDLRRKTLAVAREKTRVKRAALQKQARTLEVKEELYSALLEKV